MKKVLLDLSDIMGYYCYKKIQKNEFYRHYTFKEIDNYIDLATEIAAEKDIWFRIDTCTFKSLVDVVLKYNMIFQPFVTNEGLAGFSVHCDVSSNLINAIILSALNSEDLEFLDMIFIASIEKEKNKLNIIDYEC